MKPLYRYLIIFLVLAALVVSLFSYGCRRESLKDNQTQAAPSQKNRLTILMLGVDNRAGEKMARADSIVLATIDRKKNQISFLSIPRDTRVQIPGHGWQKINAATVLGGTDVMKQVVEELVGVNVNRYILTDFNGFKDIVDTLGGVNVDVDQNMRYNGVDIKINLKKGKQKLNGDQALQFVRYRNYALGDIDRTKHQLVFLQALAEESLQAKTILKLPKLIPELRRAVKTDMVFTELLTLSKIGRGLDNNNILTQTLPGQFLDIDGISYWQVDPKKAREVMAQLLKSMTTSEIVNGPNVVVESKPSQPNSETTGDKPSNGQVPEDQIPSDDPGDTSPPSWEEPPMDEPPVAEPPVIDPVNPPPGDMPLDFYPPGDFGGEGQEEMQG